MKLSMMVLITSSTPNRCLSQAAMPDHAAPAAAPPHKARGNPIADWAMGGQVVANPANTVAAVAPARNWPSAPMLRTPARNAMATANPVRMSGVARTRVAETIAYSDPSDPRQNAPSAWAILAVSATISPTLWTSARGRSAQASASDRGAGCGAPPSGCAHRSGKVPPTALDNVYNREDHRPPSPGVIGGSARTAAHQPACCTSDRWRHAEARATEDFTLRSIQSCAGRIGPAVDTQFAPSRGRVS